VSLGVAERMALQAIVESADPRVTANERLRAIELLAAAGGSEDEAALRLALRILQMSEVELRHEMTGFFRTDGGATSR
jgi:hypothetical protein